MPSQLVEFSFRVFALAVGAAFCIAGNVEVQAGNAWAALGDALITLLCLVMARDGLEGPT